VTLGELAAAEQVKPPTMTRLVTAMEAQGLVKREGDASDARVVRVRATPKGIRILQEGRARRIARLQAALQDRSEEELALLGRATALLGEVVQSL
jgi:DNA-binding MarR family transcriptional regulator